MTAQPPPIALVVLDFDGTLTDVDSHAPAFYAASRQALGALMAWDEPTQQQEWARAFDAITQLPPTAAWIVEGREVCPAAADPYMIANSVTHRLLGEHRPELPAAERVTRVLEVHHAAYQRVTPAFRPDARQVLETLLAQGYSVRVVSNSRTQAIERMLDALDFEGRERVVVCGEAGKFSVCGTTVPDVRFLALPEAAEWWEGGRAILLRRGQYFDVLRSIWDATGTSPQQTLVIGDIFELDLAMPSALGAHVHLVTRAGTLPHEVRLANARPRGGSGAALAAALERLKR